MDFISPWIHTTSKCNMKCHYCYVRGDETMPPKVYDALESMLLKTRVKDIHLRFAGGEPLLVFDVWKPFVERMLKRGGTRVEVITNLRCVPGDFWDFAELDDVSVSVSVDNGKRYKILDRDIIDKLTRLKNPWVLTTITKDNINRLDIMAAIIGERGYGWSISTDYFEATPIAWETLSIALHQVQSILKEFNYDFSKISFNNLCIKDNFSGCRAGREMFTVAPDGLIYRCQTQIGQESMGSVFEAYKPMEIAQRDECRPCSINELCTGWCPIYFKPPNKMCNVIKIFASEAIKEVRNAK